MSSELDLMLKVSADATGFATEIKKVEKSTKELNKTTLDGNKNNAKSQKVTLKVLQERAKEERRLGWEAKKIYESTRTEAEKYADEVERLKKHLKEGRIDQETFNRAMKEAGAGFESTREKMNSFGKVAAGAIAGVAVSFGAFIKQQLDFSDSLQKMADRTGMTTEELSGLKYAAEMSGSSLEAVEKAAVEMSKQIGTGGAAFKELGIQIEDVNGEVRPTIDLMGEVADRFKDMPDGAGKSAEAMKIFGSAGADLIPLLNAGSEGIEEMRDEAERLGVVLSTEAANSAANFNDSMQRLTTRFKGLAMQVFANVVPQIEAYADATVEAADKTGDLDGIADKIATTFGLMGRIVEGARVSFVLAGETIGAVFASIFEAAKRQIEMYTGLLTTLGNAAKAALKGNFADAARIAKEGGQRATSQVKASIDSQAALWKGYGSTVVEIVEDSGKRMESFSKRASDSIAPERSRTAFKQIAEEAERSVDKQVKAGDLLAAKRKEWAEAEKAWDKEQVELGKLREKFADMLRTDEERALVKYAANLKELDVLLAAGKISVDDYAASVSHLNDELTKTGDATAESKEAISDMAKIGDAAAGSIMGSFKTALFDPMNANFADMVTSFARAIGEMALEVLALQAMKSAAGALGGSPIGFASGGYVSGAGTGTSDSIPARLSNGEFVQRARAVQHYGKGFMDDLNNLRIPRHRRYADGGLVTASGARPSGGVGGGSSGGSSVDVTVVNAQNERQVLDVLASRAGSKVILNTFMENKRTLRL